MYPARFSLPFVTGVLVAAAERRRPGLGPWSPAVREALRGVFASELAEVRRSFFELFPEGAEHWERLERALLDDAFPRYAALAERQTALEQRDYGLWRGGDLLARLAYAGAGLVLGGLCVKLPFIPIPETWDVFAFATMLGAPFVPDLQVGWHRWRYRKAIEAVQRELAQGEQAQRLYQPLGVAPGESPLSPVAPVASSEASAAPRDPLELHGGKP
jgi:hypothetical protein